MTDTTREFKPRDWLGEAIACGLYQQGDPLDFNED